MKTNAANSKQQAQKTTLNRRPKKQKCFTSFPSERLRSCILHSVEVLLSHSLLKKITIVLSKEIRHKHGEFHYKVCQRREKWQYCTVISISLYISLLNSKNVRNDLN
jgi:hypothetical protein